MSGITPGGSTSSRNPLCPLFHSVRNPFQSLSRYSVHSARTSSWGWVFHRSSGRFRCVQGVGAALALSCALFSGASARASEDPHSYPRQREAFVGSMCDQDWFQALYFLDNMLELEETPELYRKALQVYRPQLALYLANDVDLLRVMGCDRVALPPSAEKENYVLPSRR